MKKQKSGSLMKLTGYGLIAGVVGTFIMDKITTRMYNRESEQTKRKESELMKEPAYTILAKKAAEKAGLQLTDRQVSGVGTLIHWSYGLFWGGLYGALHDRVPALAKARGVVYGLSVFLLGDEALNTVLKISPPPQDFPLAVHARGLVGHIVYAAAMDGTYRMLKQAA